MTEDQGQPDVQPAPAVTQAVNKVEATAVASLDNEIKDLMNIIDMAVKSEGLKIAHIAANLGNKVMAAFSRKKQQIQQAVQPEAPKQ